MSVKIETLHPIFIAVITSFALVAAAILLFPPNWMTIDDVTMNLVLAGLTGPPDEHIKYIHPLLGHLLKALYLSNNKIAWYALFHIILHSSALSVIFIALLHRRKFAEALGLFCIFFIADLAVLCQMQHTNAAFILAQAAFAVTLSYADNPQDQNSRKLLITSVFFVLLSFMMRWRAAEISLVITLLYLLILHGTSLSKNAKEALFATMIALAAGETLHQNYISFYETDPNWKGFFRWHEIVNEYADFNRVKADTQALQNANWSNNDLAMMRSFNYLDPKIFNNDTAEIVLSAAKTTTRANLDQNYLVKEVLRLLCDPGSLVSLTLLATCNFVIFVRRKDWLMNAILLSVILLIDGFLICFLKNTQYIFVPLWGFPLLTLLLRAPADFASSKPRRIVAAICVLLCFAGALTFQQNRSRQAKNRRAILLREIAQINPTRQQLYILMPFSLPITYISPFDNPLEIFKDLNLMNSSLIYSLQARQLERFGTTDFLKLINNKNVRFLASDYVDSARQVEIFSDEHYKLKVKMVPVYHSNELHYGAYKAVVERSTQQ